jgi:hypothetical protein
LIFTPVPDSITFIETVLLRADIFKYTTLSIIFPKKFRCLLIPYLRILLLPKLAGTVMVVIIGKLDTQLPTQSVIITINIVSLNHAHGEVYSIQLYDKVCQLLAAGRWFSPGTLVASTNETDRQDITEILLKMALNITTLTPTKILLHFSAGFTYGIHKFANK